MDNPWQTLPLSPPFLLPQDRVIVDQFNRQAREEHRIHPEIIPDAYLGRPDASVVLLNGNPGFKVSAIPRYRDPVLLAAARRNLLHETSEYPFYLLDPDAISRGHSGGRGS